MSDLHCPATFLIARHGEAKSHMNGVRSPEGVLTDKGRRQVQQLVKQLRRRRVAAVYSSQMPPALESAALAASQLGLRPVVLDGLQELSAGDLKGVTFSSKPTQDVIDAWLFGNLDVGTPGGTALQRVIKRFGKAIDGIADTHRGESVLIFTHGGVMSLAIPSLSLNMRNDLQGRRFLPNCAVAEVEVDADGWRLLSWPSAAHVNTKGPADKARPCSHGCVWLCRHLAVGPR
jgi:probable phosphoglycerate mutase